MFLKQMKSELKEMAASIHSSRQEFKKRQRGLSAFQSAHPNSRYWGHLEHKLMRDFLKKPENTQYFPWPARPEDFRLKHIAYCLLRGRKYEEIEPKVKAGNAPDWKRIDDLVAIGKAVLAKEADDAAAEALCDRAG